MRKKTEEEASYRDALYVMRRFSCDRFV